jgi:hypothetical protein
VGILALTEVDTSLLSFCRAIVVALSAFDRQNLELDMMGHPLLNILYYSLCEILPTACVLYILRKLPPKRVQQPAVHPQGYQQIPSQQQ